MLRFLNDDMYWSCIWDVWDTGWDVCLKIWIKELGLGSNYLNSGLTKSNLKFEFKWICVQVTFNSKAYNVHVEVWVSNPRVDLVRDMYRFFLYTFCIPYDLCTDTIPLYNSIPILTRNRTESKVRSTPQLCQITCPYLLSQSRPPCGGVASTVNGRR
jgi:hypothetical protein